MRAVDVRVHRRKAVNETFSDKGLRGQMVTLIEFVLAYYAKEAWITLHARRVQRDLIQKMAQASKAALRIFKRDSPDESMHFVTLAQKVFGQIASVLTGNAGY